MKISQVVYKDLYEFHKNIKDDENNIYYAISFNKRIFWIYSFFNDKNIKLKKIYI